MSDNFSKIPIDFSKYRELLSDDNPKIPEDRFPTEAFMQNQGDKIGSCPVCNLHRKEQNEGADQDLNPSGYAEPTEPAEPKSLDNGKTDDPQLSNTEPWVEDQVDMSPQVNQNRDEDVNPVNTYREEEPKPWELSDDERPSSPETTNPDQVKAVGYGKI